MPYTLKKPVKTGHMRLNYAISFTEVLEELPALTFEQRQLLIRRAMELDDQQLTDADVALIESRLAAHHDNPSSSIPLEEMKARLRNRTKS